MGPEGSGLKLSENGNDFWALDKCGYRNGLFFVDIGAGDGITGSNTWILEKFYKWNGICVDPNPAFLKSLCGSRDTVISDLAIWDKSGEILDFNYLKPSRNEFFGWNFRSGISSCVGDTAVEFDKHKVFSITLNDLLELNTNNKIGDFNQSEVYSVEVIGEKIYFGLTDYAKLNKVKVISRDNLEIASYDVGIIPGDFAVWNK